MLYLSTPQHPLSQGPDQNLPQNLTRPAQRALKFFKKNNEMVDGFLNDSHKADDSDGGHDCHKAAWWKQTGFIENATGPCEQVLNSGQQTVAYVIRPFEWLA